MEHDEREISSPLYTESPLEVKRRTQSPELLKRADKDSALSNKNIEPRETDLATPSSSKFNESSRSTKRKINDSDDFFIEARNAIQQLAAPAAVIPSLNNDELDYLFIIIYLENWEKGLKNM